MKNVIRHARIAHDIQKYDKTFEIKDAILGTNQIFKYKKSKTKRKGIKQQKQGHVNQRGGEYKQINGEE